MTDREHDYKWLENHINSAVEEVKNWPAWKSQASTLASSDKDSVEADQAGPRKKRQ
jgi:hypothetical protein